MVRAMLMLATCAACAAYAPQVQQHAAMVAPRAATPAMETVDDLKVLAKELNPKLGYWEPLGLTDITIFGMDQTATIGFLRHAELKHGRVAMAAFVGYIVGANGIHFPWALGGGVSYADIAAAGSPPAQWDAVPTAAKLQILLFIGLLEFFGESTYALEQSGEKHYMKGGKPGFYPSLKTAGVPHPVPFDLFNPFGFSNKGATAEQLARRRAVEINNGRAAMIGIMGFVSASKGLIVPGLDTVSGSYAGEIMAPFSSVNSDLPLVSDMLKYPFF